MSQVHRDDRREASGRGPASQFHTTRWSVVLAAGRKSSPDRQQALATLCESYWYPVYVFVRRQGHNAADAQDLTQAYFARLLERNDFAGLRPERGKFRAFLLAAMRHFLANEWDRRKAQKRGGDVLHFSIDFTRGENRYLDEPVDTQTAELAFEREWALTLLETVREKLRQQYQQSGQADQFEKLHELLSGAPPAGGYRKLAEKLEMTEGAVRVAVHRLRRRFGEQLREAIADTVSDPEQIDDEIRHLFCVLRS